jgi:hypothetical protein
VWCDGVRTRERDCETLKECIIVASMALSAHANPNMVLTVSEIWPKVVLSRL